MRSFPLKPLALLSLILLSSSLPFEVESPLLTLGAVRLTNLEALLAITLTLTLAVVINERRWQIGGWTKIPAAWLWLWALFTLGLVLSAILAPEHQLNAWKATARSLSGLLLALAVPQLIRTRADFAWLAVGLLAGGFAAILLGLAEVQSGEIAAELERFRRQATVVGPYLRLSGPFNHANQAAMFVEATLPLLVAAGWLILHRGRALWSALVLLACLVYLSAAVLTLSRAGYLTILVSNLLVAALILRGGKSEGARTVPWLGVASMTVLLVAVNTSISPVSRLRLTSEGDNEWYELTFQAPEAFELSTGETVHVPLDVANEGTLTWSSETSNPVRIGARLYRQQDRTTVLRELRWSLQRKVEPGNSFSMTVPLEAPIQPGQYWLEWDMVQEHVTWFASKNGQKTASRLTVTGVGPGPEHQPENSVDAPDLASQPIPDRRTLWRIAAIQWKNRPILGIGLDNFRLTHGEVMGWPAWNTSIHTNNWYVETLVSLGLAGSLPFFVWLLTLGLDVVRTVAGQGNRLPRNYSAVFPAVRASAWQIALAVGLLAFLIHGFFDYFLLFNGTGLLFWLLVGLWISLRYIPAPAAVNTRERTMG